MDLVTMPVAPENPGAPLPSPKRSRKKLILAALAVTAAAAVAACALLLPVNAQETVSTYKESKVTRGTLTAGISETGTVSIDYETVKYEISANKMEDLGIDVTVEEVYVKSGQKVEAGDPLLRISTTDLQEQLANSQLTLKQAQASLTQAQLDQTLKKLEAESAYQENLALADNAELQYQLTLKSLDNSIASYEDEVAEYQKQIKILKGYLGVSESAMEYFEDHFDEYTGSIESVTYGEYASNDETRAYQEIKSLQSKLETASNQLEEAKLSLETKKTQAENQLASDQFTSENAKTLYEITLAQIENSLTTAQLKVESAQNDIDKFTEYLASDGVISSPVSGTIMMMNYAAGDDISSSQAIAMISNPREASISVSIVQEDITSLDIGQQAVITLDAFPDQTFTGQLDSMSVQPGFSGGSTVSYTVNTRFDQPDEKFLQGMTGSVTFITTQLEDVLMVSNRAITNTDGVQTVKVKGEDGAIQVREITTGFSDGSRVEVLSGLEEGETVLIESQVAAA